LTGGPDGDLGSNEILQGQERIVGVVDKSGVLFDPEGIEKTQLEELARSRQTVSAFNGAISPKGYLVLVTDEKRTL